MTDTPTPEETPKATHGGARTGAGRKVGSKDTAPRTRKGIGSFSLQLRISDKLKAKLAERAEQRGVPMPTIAREILEAYFTE